MSYNDILQVRMEIEELKENIQQTKSQNVVLEKQVMNYMNTLQNEFNIQNQRAVVIAEMNTITKKVENLSAINSTLKSELKKSLDTTNCDLEYVSQYLNLLHAQTVHYQNTHVKIQKQQNSQLQKINLLKKKKQYYQEKLISKTVELTNLSPTTLFNIDLSRVLSYPMDQKEWNQLPPEQLGVLISYIHHITSLYLKYNMVFVRYKIRDDIAMVVDPVFDRHFKLIETNYKLFKKENTLRPAIYCLKVIIDELENSRRLNNFSSKPRLTCKPEKTLQSPHDSLLIQLNNLKKIK